MACFDLNKYAGDKDLDLNSLVNDLLQSIAGFANLLIYSVSRGLSIVNHKFLTTFPTF
jgi:hypothetical protein